MRYLLVDRITEVVPWRRATGVKGVALGEDYFTDHFPERPVMPGVLMTEALVQLSSWLIASSSDFRHRARIISLARVKFRKFVGPGMQLELRVALGDSATPRIRVEGGVIAAGAAVMQAEFFIVRDLMRTRGERARQRRHFNALFEPRGERS